MKKTEASDGDQSLSFTERLMIKRITLEQCPDGLPVAPSLTCINLPPSFDKERPYSSHLLARHRTSSIWNQEDPKEGKPHDIRAQQTPYPHLAWEELLQWMLHFSSTAIKFIISLSGRKSLYVNLKWQNVTSIFSLPGKE